MLVVIGYVGTDHGIPTHMDVVETIHQAGEVVHIQNSRGAIRSGLGIECGHRTAGVREIDSVAIAVDVVFSGTRSSSEDGIFARCPSNQIFNHGFWEAKSPMIIQVAAQRQDDVQQFG